MQQQFIELGQRVLPAKPPLLSGGPIAIVATVHRLGCCEGCRSGEPNYGA